MNIHQWKRKKNSYGNVEKKRTILTIHQKSQRRDEKLLDMSQVTLTARNLPCHHTGVPGWQMYIDISEMGRVTVESAIACARDNSDWKHLTLQHGITWPREPASLVSSWQVYN